MFSAQIFILTFSLALKGREMTSKGKDQIDKISKAKIMFYNLKM